MWKKNLRFQKGYFISEINGCHGPEEYGASAIHSVTCVKLQQSSKFYSLILSDKVVNSILLFSLNLFFWLYQSILIITFMITTNSLLRLKGERLIINMYILQSHKAEFSNKSKQ